MEAARTNHATEAKEAATRAEADANRFRAVLNQLGEAESAIEAQDLHIIELGSAIQAAEARATRAEERAERAEEEREAASLAAEREAKIKDMEATAEARAARAVEEFRASEHYVDELAKTSADAYLQGFRCGKEKVAWDLNLPQALEVEPKRLSEVASSDDEPIAADL